MNLLATINYINDLLAVPATFIFLCVALILTVKTRFLQIRGFPRFLKLITKGVVRKKRTTTETMDSFHALFIAMATTLGMGNIIGPSIAIITGGPGALFWLVVYAILGAATKFTEVVCALHTRVSMPGGNLVGGPMEYLRFVSPFIASWYAVAMMVLMAGWSGLQANTLANIFAQEAVPVWVTGLALAVTVFVVLRGGARRVGIIASKLVPLMSILYIIFALLILFKDLTALSHAFYLIFSTIFTPAAAFGGFAGATVCQALRAGVYKSIFITEAGIGTSSIPHAMADVQNPTDQGILAMFSMGADAFLSCLSGLLVLVTGLWLDCGFTSTVMYHVFKLHAPAFGGIVLMASILLFVLTTAIGNCFNGSQTFASCTQNRFVLGYQLAAVIVIFLGSLMNVPLIWSIMDMVLTFVAIPNLVGVVLLAYRKPEWFKG
jgi:alanine or glycine:cation symporter, AGCS family